GCIRWGRMRRWRWSRSCSLVLPVGVPRRTAGLVILVAAAFLGLEAVRRQAVREAPEATEGVGAALRGMVSRVPHRTAQPAASVPDRVRQLERLASLHERGAIS